MLEAETGKLVLPCQTATPNISVTLFPSLSRHSRILFFHNLLCVFPHHLFGHRSTDHHRLDDSVPINEERSRQPAQLVGFFHPAILIEENREGQLMFLNKRF